MVPSSRSPELRPPKPNPPEARTESLPHAHPKSHMYLCTHTLSILKPGLARLNRQNSWCGCKSCSEFGLCPEKHCSRLILPLCSVRVLCPLLGSPVPQRQGHHTGGRPAQARDNGHKPKYRNFHLNIKRKICICIAKVVKHQNRLPTGVVESLPWKIFQTQPDMVLSSLLGFTRL